MTNSILKFIWMMLKLTATIILSITIAVYGNPDNGLAKEILTWISFIILGFSIYNQIVKIDKTYDKV